MKWLATSDEGVLIGVLTCELLWDWLYIDELWVDENSRRTGLGKKLMQKAEQHAFDNNLTGVWLWTQSWQAEDFYKHMGYEEFARLPNFPKGYLRIGFRKMIHRNP